MKNMKKLFVGIFFFILNLLLISNVYSSSHSYVFLNITLNNNTFVGDHVIYSDITSSEESINFSMLNNKFVVNESYFYNFLGLNITLNNFKYGNYWGKSDGTGYSDTCNDTNNDGICDLPYENIDGTGYIDYLPLARWPYIQNNNVNNIKYLPDESNLIVTLPPVVYSGVESGENYSASVYVEDSLITDETITNNTVNGTNLTINTGVKICGLLNTTVVLHNENSTYNISGVVDYGKCSYVGSGGSYYNSPENPYYILIIFVFVLFIIFISNNKLIKNKNIN